MAFNLRAILKLDDQFTNPMRKIERQMRQTERMTQKMSDSNSRLNSTMNRAKYQAYKMQSGMNAASASFLKFGKSVSSSMNVLQNSAHLRTYLREVRRGLPSLGKSGMDAFKTIGRGALSAGKAVLSLKTGFLGLAAAIGGVVAAKKVFSSTVGEAMKFEQSSIMIDAMFDNKKVSERYKDMMQKMAIDSPLLNSQDIFGNSKSFIMLTKNTDQLKEMWSLVERLNAVDPAQGVEGAVFALKELFSGDARSMVERFEMDRQTLKGIKNLPLERQLVELDKYFNKMGITQKLINEMGGTTLGIWNQVQEQLQLVFRQMGEPSLKVLRNFLTNILDKLQSGELDRFAQMGANIIEKIISGLTNGAMKIYNWFSALTSSPEFQKQTTLFGKVDFIISDLYEKFKSWYDSGGSEMITNVANDTTDFLINALNANIPRFVDIGLKIGSGIFQGIRESLGQHLTGNIPTTGRETKEQREALKNMTLDWDDIPNIKKNNGNIKSQYAKPPKGKSHASGLERVPYNGYQATLHKDEKVLTPEEAKAQRNGASGITIAKLADQIVVREDADIDKIAEALYTKINGALEAGA